MASQVDQKRAFNKLKHDLEPWRYLIIQLDSILKWEKKFYPAIVWGSITTIFLVLWLLNLSTVTLLSLAGLVAIAFDFGYPKILIALANPENWTGTQEAQFEQACTQLCAIKMNIASWSDLIFTAKEQKSTLFVVVLTILLLSLAYLGAIINNFLLMYIIIITIVMYPGIKKKNLMRGMKEKCGFLRNKANKVE